MKGLLNALTATGAPLRFIACLGIWRGVWSLFKLLEREKAVFKPESLKQIVDLIQAPASILSLVEMLPNAVLSAFDAIFTDNLLSWRGFRRSIRVSVWTVILLLLLWYSTMPTYVHFEIDIPKRVIGGPPIPLPFRGNSLLNYANYAVISRIYFNTGVATSVDNILFVFLAPFVYNFFVDYFCIIVTRRALGLISRIKTNLIILSMFILSACVIVLIASVGFALYAWLVNVLTGQFTVPHPLGIRDLIQRIAFPFYITHTTVFGRPWTVHTIMGVFLCSTLIGIFWVGTFSAAAIIANPIMKINGLGPFLQRKIRVQRQPFKVMGGIIVIILAVVCVGVYVIVEIPIFHNRSLSWTTTPRPFSS